MLSKMPWFTNYTNRKLEWTLAIYTLYFGIWLLMPWSAMNTPSFTQTLEFASEQTWGIAYTLVGIMHNYALHVNGRAAWTPFARCLALLMNANVFLAMAFGLFHTNPGGTGTATYSFMVFGFCGAALFTAAHDVGREIKIWRKNKNAGTI